MSKTKTLWKRSKKTLYGCQNLKEAIKLPEREDLNEWLAVNTTDCFRQLNLLYGSITEFCTPALFPVMNAGRFEFRWVPFSEDPDKKQKAVKLSAPQYIDNFITWLQDTQQNENVFPVNKNQNFPATFLLYIKFAFKQMLRIYAHIYYEHFEKILKLGEEPHLNTCFLHFYYLCTEFSLVKEEYFKPLEGLVENLEEGFKLHARRDRHKKEKSRGH